jgi:shikimate kinase
MPVNPNINIYLIGLMGSGKTTLGRQLAKRLGRPFLDSDHEIEARTGVDVSTIFAIEGEAGFRRRETQVIGDLTRETAIVMATGGGAVLDAANRKRLCETGWVVYLNVAPALLFGRTRHDRGRPLLQVEDPLARLESLYAARDPLYREIAHFTVESGHLTPFALLQLLTREFSRQCAPSR